MQIITGEKKKYRYFIAPERGAWNTGAFLYIVQVKIKSKCPLSVLADGD